MRMDSSASPIKSPISWLAVMTYVRVVVLVVLAIYMGAPLTTLAQKGKPEEFVINYGDITLDALLSVYKAAYTGAGFRFKDQVTSERKLFDGETVTYLEFEFDNPRSPQKQKAVTRFRFISKAVGAQKCAPCSVSLETLHGYLSEYMDDPRLEEYSRFVAEISDAGRKANATVTSKLSKNLLPR